MAENNWGSLGGLFGPLQEEFQKNLKTNFTNVVKGLEKVLSENDKLGPLLGLGDESQKKLNQDPTLATPPAPAPAQPPSRSASASSTGSNSTLGRASSASSAPAPAKAPASSPGKASAPAPASSPGKASAPAPAQSLGRSASAPPKAPASSPAKASAPASTSSLNRSASASSAPASTSSLNRSASASSAPASSKVSTSTLGRSDSISSPRSKALSNESDKSSPSFFARKLSSFLSDLNESQSNGPSRAPSRTKSTTSSRGPSKDNLGKEDGGNKLPSLFSGLSQGLSKCKSSLYGNRGLYVNVEVKKQQETIFKAETKISLPSLPRAPSFNGVRSGFRRGASGLGRSLSKTLSEASEKIVETRRSSSGVRENWRNVKHTFKNLGDFKSSGPSLFPSPSSFTHLGSDSTRHKENAKAALKESRELLGAASASSRDVLRSWSQSVKESATGLSASVSFKMER